MKRMFLALPGVLLIAACAADGTTVGTAPAASPAPVAATVSTPATTGKIAKVESGAPAVRQGGGAALAIGASVLGAFIPGPWGGVASVAAGQTGRVALENYQANTVRYTVRMSDGTVRTITQKDALALPVGTPVEFVTLSSGSQRMVQTDVVLP